MNRRLFLIGASCCGIALSGCLETGDSEAWETVERCTEETAIQVESVGDALEEWLQSPETFDSTRFNQLADDTQETLDGCEADIEQHLDDIEDETILPDEKRDRFDGGEVVTILEELFDTGWDSQQAASAVLEADGDPDVLTVEEEADIETVADEYDEVLADVDPLL